jgi:hypothetical protein
MKKKLKKKKSQPPVFTQEQVDSIIDVLRRIGPVDLKGEVAEAMAELRRTFRDGPVLINMSLIKLARDILNEHIREVLRDQVRGAMKDLYYDLKSKKSR